MNAQDMRQASTAWAETAAENAWFKLFARASIVIASTVCLPLAVTIGWRTVDSIDALRQFQTGTAIRMTAAEREIDELRRESYPRSAAVRDREEYDRRFTQLGQTDERLERRIEAFSGRQ